MEQKEVNEIVEKHKIWLETEGEMGKQANFSRANLSHINLRGADLQGVNFFKAAINVTDFSGSNLQDTCFTHTYLDGGMFFKTDLRRADFRYSHSCLSVFHHADLRGANFKHAYILDTDFRGAHIKGSKLPNFSVCPRSGSFIAWKKLYPYIIKLEIPSFARRTSCLSSRKCRAELAFVLEIEDFISHKKIKSLINDNPYHKVQYEVGKFVSPNSYNPDIREVCTNGIHFFMTYDEAFDW